MKLGESSDYTTMFLEEHNVLRSPRSGLCVYDTRGFDHNILLDNEGLDEVSTWMSDGVRHNQPCYRLGDDPKFMRSNCARYVKRRVNCVMVVADLLQIHRAFNSADFKSIEAFKSLFHLDCIKNLSKFSHSFFPQSIFFDHGIILYNILKFPIIK